MIAIPATTVANLRDLGDTPLARRPHGPLRPGLPRRSARPHGPGGRPGGGRARARTIVDFRTAAERADHPDRVPAGARLAVADALADKISAPGAPAAAQLKHVLADPVVAEEHLGGGKAQTLFADTYRSLVSSHSARSAYRALLTELAADDAGPLLFHCTAGKDRTGWAATVILTLLGADEATVEREYLSVNPAVRQAFAPLIEGFIAQGGDPEIALAIIGVVPEYLAAALDEVATEYGSMEKYAREGLGVPDDAVARLRERLIA